ncbi:MAG: hypothetical protein CMA31_00615 [Euryarchaeota archaeon]|jgi:hypothetical protein|nr:hypothetical protein [Euryarchaeota archaeon]|tara:strand:- start:720 stop:923 length:204 start_codon:yes stop_codon:yes gene_type:complete
MKAWSFKLRFCYPSKLKTIKSFVYSDTGTDIEERFYPNVVSNIKEIKDPLKNIAFTGWGKKKESKYI